MKRAIGQTIFAAIAFSSLGTMYAQNSDQPAYLNTALAAEQRAADLVHRMTIEEKVTQLVNQARAIPRLNVPAYDWWSESLHGVATNGTTEFPEPIGLAATFDTDAIHRMAIMIGTEGRIKHVQAVRAGHSNIFEGLDFWAPNINIFRDPRWGRGQETYGEDPFLTARMGVAFVTGMQGDDPKYYRVISTPKHYAVHSGPEPLRQSRSDLKLHGSGRLLQRLQVGVASDVVDAAQPRRNHSIDGVGAASADPDDLDDCRRSVRVLQLDGDAIAVLVADELDHALVPPLPFRRFPHAMTQKKSRKTFRTELVIRDRPLLRRPADLWRCP